MASEVEKMTDIPHVQTTMPRAFTFPPSLDQLELPSHFSSYTTTRPPQVSQRQDSSILRPRRSLRQTLGQRHADEGRQQVNSDSNYIRRPENAFILFRRKCCEERQAAARDEKLDGPAKKQRQAELSKTISQQWMGLSSEERKVWEDKAKEKKKEHEAMYPNYVYHPQRSRDRTYRNKDLTTPSFVIPPPELHRPPPSPTIPTYLRFSPPAIPSARPSSPSTSTRRTPQVEVSEDVFSNFNLMDYTLLPIDQADRHSEAGVRLPQLLQNISGIPDPTSSSQKLNHQPPSPHIPTASTSSRHSSPSYTSLANQPFTQRLIIPISEPRPGGSRIPVDSSRNDDTVITSAELHETASNTSQDGVLSKHLLEVLVKILRLPERADKLLQLRGNNAQIMIDFLHSVLLLPMPESPTWPRQRALIALYKLSKATMLYPQCYVLKNIAPDFRDSPEDSGGFCDIYRGRHPTEQKSFCLKAVRIYKKSETDKVLKMFSKEAVLWAHLRHPNILPFYGVHYLDDSQKRICLVSPWMSNGNIVAYLKANPNIPRRPFVHDIACGMNYLHRENIIHGDLKGMNVLVNDLGIACVADFGLSLVLTDKNFGFSNASNTISGATNRWLSPELLVPASKPSRESDVWAFSCVWYELMTRKVPYHECSNDSQVVIMLFRGYLPSRPESTSDLDGIDDETWYSMKRCWKSTPTDRPTFSEILHELEQLEGYGGKECGSTSMIFERNSLGIMEMPEVCVDLSKVERILQEL